MSHNLPKKISTIYTKTPILTTSGWKAAENVKVGDRVFDFRGMPATVVYKTPVQHNYKIYCTKFNDHSFIDTNAYTYLHANTFVDREGRLKYSRKIKELINEAKEKSNISGLPWEVHLDKEVHELRKKTYINKKHRVGHIKNHLYYGNFSHYNYRVGRYKPKFFPTIFQKLDPYVLGVWTMKGQRKMPVVNIGKRYWVKRIVEKTGHKMTPYQRHLGYYYRNHYYIKGLFKHIKRLRMTEQKYIPNEYLYCSEEQRLRYIQGMMDVRGYKKNGKYIVPFIDTLLLSQFVVMIRSLGIDCEVITKKRKELVEGVKRRDLHLVRFITDKHVMNGPMIKDRISVFGDIKMHKERPVMDVRDRGNGYMESVGFVVDAPCHGFLVGASFVPMYDNYGVIREKVYMGAKDDN